VGLTVSSALFWSINAAGRRAQTLPLCLRSLDATATVCIRQAGVGAQPQAPAPSRTWPAAGPRHHSPASAGAPPPAVTPRPPAAAAAPPPPVGQATRLAGDGPGWPRATAAAQSAGVEFAGRACSGGGGVKRAAPLRVWEARGRNASRAREPAACSRLAPLPTVPGRPSSATHRCLEQQLGPLRHHRRHVSAGQQRVQLQQARRDAGHVLNRSGVAVRVGRGGPKSGAKARYGGGGRLQRSCRAHPRARGLPRLAPSSQLCNRLARAGARPALHLLIICRIPAGAFYLTQRLTQHPTPPSCLACSSSRTRGALRAWSFATMSGSRLASASSRSSSCSWFMSSWPLGKGAGGGCDGVGA
jgi:hypothetical protein